MVYSVIKKPAGTGWREMSDGLSAGYDDDDEAGSDITRPECKKPLLLTQQGLCLFCFDDGISIRF